MELTRHSPFYKQPLRDDHHSGVFSVIYMNADCCELEEGDLLLQGTLIGVKNPQKIGRPIDSEYAYTGHTLEYCLPDEAQRKRPAEANAYCVTMKRNYGARIQYFQLSERQIEDIKSAKTDPHLVRRFVKVENPFSGDD